VSSAELQSLVEGLAEELDAPALIEDDELRLVAYSSHRGLFDEVRRESILLRQPPAAVADWLSRYRLTTAVRPVRIPTDHGRGILGRLCVPIRYRGSSLGYLWLIDDEVRLGAKEVATAVRAAEQAASLMLDVVLAERLASGALAHLLSPLPELRGDGARQIEDSGLLGLAGRVVVIVVQADPAATPDLQPRIADGLRVRERQHVARNIVGLANADHGVLLARGLADEAAELRLASAAREDLLARLRHDQTGSDVTAGIGDATSTLADAHLAYRQARHAARVAAAATATGPIARWRDIGVFRTLAQLPAGDETTATLDPRLTRLLDEAGEPVIATLETYLDLAGDVKATTDRLHVHRGTLYYRLQKAERLAGISLRDGNDRLAIHLGFKLARLSGLYPRQHPTGSHAGLLAADATAQVV
jgi:hypothetical protein